MVNTDKLKLIIPSTNIDISINPFNGRNPSYCFADFPTQAAASHALQVLPGKLIRNRLIPLHIYLLTADHLPFLLVILKAVSRWVTDFIDKN